jgi:hypothetical protein
MSDLMRLTRLRSRSQDDGLPTRRDACGSNALATLKISGGHPPNRRNRSGVSIGLVVPAVGRYGWSPPSR